MLMITIKNGESVMIGDSIKIVGDRHRNNTRIGIEAPRELRIRRVPTEGKGKENAGKQA